MVPNGGPAHRRKDEDAENGYCEHSARFYGLFSFQIFNDIPQVRMHPGLHLILKGFTATLL